MCWNLCANVFVDIFNWTSRQEEALLAFTSDENVTCIVSVTQQLHQSLWPRSGYCVFAYTFMISVTFDTVMRWPWEKIIFVRLQRKTKLQDFQKIFQTKILNFLHFYSAASFACVKFAELKIYENMSLLTHPLFFILHPLSLYFVNIIMFIMIRMKGLGRLVVSQSFNVR